MSCCGQSTRRTAAPPPSTNLARGTASTTAVTPLKLTCTLRYSGTTAITTIGPVTGRRYHFGGPGARLDVDVRDRDAILRVPGIQQA